MCIRDRPGSAYLYQGEELGLEQVDVPEAQRQDPQFLHGRDVGRDGCRVPIPWSGDAPPFGNGRGAPWLPQPEGWRDLTVEVQATDPDSTLSYYRRMLAMRRRLDADAVTLLPTSPGVVGFRRGRVTALLNAGDRSVPLPDGEVLLASGPLGDGLPPDTAVWVQDTASL